MWRTGIRRLVVPCDWSGPPPIDPRTYREHEVQGLRNIPEHGWEPTLLSPCLRKLVRAPLQRNPMPLATGSKSMVAPRKDLDWPGL